MLIRINAHWECAEEVVREVTNRWGDRQEIELIFNTSPVVCLCPKPKEEKKPTPPWEKYTDNIDGSNPFAQGSI